MSRPTWIEINVDAFQHNLRRIKEVSNKEIMAVLKANAYGAGDLEMAFYASEVGVNFFAVSSFDEALYLRNNGCIGEILVLGYVSPSDLKACVEHSISVTAISLDWLKKAVKTACYGLKVHLKVDTGMNRLGFKSVEEVKQGISLIRYIFKIEGIFTHFACADDCLNKKNEQQYSMFKAIVESCDYSFKWIHADNSDGMLDFDHDLCNIGRCGIAMYGYASNDHQLQPVFSLYTKIVCMKEIEQFETVSYGAEYVASNKEWIATLPIGYADGFSKRNQGRDVWISERCPIVGRICMDQMMVRCPSFYDIETIVEIFGDHISLSEVASDNNTIIYEILTTLSDRLTRIYKKNGVEVCYKNKRFM